MAEKENPKEIAEMVGKAMSDLNSAMQSQLELSIMLIEWQAP